jgi:hypothetical protein
MIHHFNLNIYFDKLRSATFFNYVHFDFLRWDIHIESPIARTWQRTRSIRKRINLKLFHPNPQPCNVFATWKTSCFNFPPIYNKLFQMFRQRIKSFGPFVVHPKCILWCVQHRTSLNTFFDVPPINSQNPNYLLVAP